MIHRRTRNITQAVGKLLKYKIIRDADARIMNTGSWCPVSLDLARRHAADLRWARFAETAFSWLSH